jgi:hypothetical protein
MTFRLKFSGIHANGSRKLLIPDDTIASDLGFSVGMWQFSFHPHISLFFSIRTFHEFSFGEIKQI